MTDDPLALLGKAAAGLNLKSLPPVIVQRAKQRVLDTVGCLVAGYNAGISDSIRAYVAAHGGNPQATLLPGGQKTSVAEREKLGGASIIEGVVVGYEIGIRFGRTVFPAANYDGWWTPGLFGAFGPAVTAAKMMNLGAKGIDNAIGIVANIAPTCMAWANEEGHTVKWLIGGQACASGVLAAEMAARGTEGMRDVVKGWIPIIARDCHPERLTEGVREDGTFDLWEIDSGVVTKHYATVGPLQAALDAILHLLHTHDIRNEDIVEIHVDAMRRTAMFAIVHPETEIGARASLAYCLAVAAVTRDPAQLLGPGFSREMLKDRTVWEAADKVKVTESEEYERQYPAHSKAKITLHLKNGKSYAHEADRSANPRYLTPSDADIEGKFRMIATSVLGQAKTDRVVKFVQQLEHQKGVQELIDALRV